MSRSLYWRPAPKDPPPGAQLPDDLMFALRKRAERDWGLLSGGIPLDKADIPYLEGLADGGGEELAEGANELIAAIREHGAVEVWQEM